jgi:hypothetical protein
VTVLAFGRDHNEVSACETRNSDVRIIPIIPQGERTLAGALNDADGNARRAYGVGDDAALIVVRPDGYIAYLGRPGSRTCIERCLSLMFGQGSCMTAGRGTGRPVIDTN